MTDADHESTRPRNTMKKKGPQRSQSLRAFPGSSRYGFGNTTSFKLLTILDMSRFTVSQTGSVSVFGPGPNPVASKPCRAPPLLAGSGGGGAEGAAGGAAAGTEGTNFWAAEEGLRGGSGGMEEGRKGEEETGIWARAGLGGRAGRTVAFMRFSISSMSDWEEAWRGTVSLWECDIFFFFALLLLLPGKVVAGTFGFLGKVAAGW